MLPQHLITLSSLFLVATTSAFSARKASQLIRTPSITSSATSTCSALNAAALLMDDDNEDDYNDFIGGSVFLMNRAEACANSESCSLEEAQTFLDDILHVQMECVGAGVLSTKSAVCDNVDVVAEVVANLRQKIQVERKRLAPLKATVHLANVAMGVYVVSTILHGFAVVPNVPVDAPLFSSFDYISPLEVNDMEMIMNSRGVTSILPQEWFWAVRDGYFPSLFSEWMHSGGLVVDTSVFENKVVAFTPQEWVWSIQNGSFGHMLKENMQYGGLVVASDYNTEGMTPMTFQDVLYSIQGGYVGTAANHFFRNGGV